jgi:light-harvesting complex 1 beta chain
VDPVVFDASDRTGTTSVDPRQMYTVAPVQGVGFGTTRMEANSMAGQSPAAQPTGKARPQAKPVVEQQQQKSVSGLTPEQAKEFHEQFKVTYTAFVGIAALVHLFVIASNPWF